MRGATDVRRLNAELDRLKQDLLQVRSDLSFRALMRALSSKFDPNQPRDLDGRWTGGGTAVASRASRALECDAQYARDTFICNALKLRSCWERAAARYAACLRGSSIPVLRF